MSCSYTPAVRRETLARAALTLITIFKNQQRKKFILLIINKIAAK